MAFLPTTMTDTFLPLLAQPVKGFQFLYAGDVRQLLLLTIPEVL